MPYFGDINKPKTFKDIAGEYDYSGREGLLKDIESLLADIKGNESEFAGIEGLGDLETKFGIKPFDLAGRQKNVKGIFDVGRRNLGNQLAKSRIATASRVGNSATPEYLFQPVEAAFAGKQSELESGEAQAQFGLQDQERQSQFQSAQLLSDIFGKKEGAKSRKLSEILSALGLKRNTLFPGGGGSDFGQEAASKVLDFIF